MFGSTCEPELQRVLHFELEYNTMLQPAVRNFSQLNYAARGFFFDQAFIYRAALARGGRDVRDVQVRYTT